MSKDYEEFVKYIFHEHIETRLIHVRLRFDHRLDRPQYHTDRLIKAIRAARFIRDFVENDEEIVKFFTPVMLRYILQQIKQGAYFSNELVVRTGIADVIQDYFGEIVEGMNADHFPEADIEILRQSGSSDPQREIIAMNHLIKSRKEVLIRESREVRFSRSLEQVTERVERIEILLSEEPQESNQAKAANQQPTVKRETFKGLGSIAQGALMTITDISLAAGWWSVPLPPETTSVGAVVSVASGIGMILTGIGELRGEG